MAGQSADSILAFIDKYFDVGLCEVTLPEYHKQVREGGYVAWKAYAIEKRAFADFPGAPLMGKDSQFQNSVWDALEPSFLKRLQARYDELQARLRKKCDSSSARSSGPGVTGAEQAIAAVHRFTPHHGQAEATPCGGASGAAFKVTVDDPNSSTPAALFVKVLSNEGIRKLRSDDAMSSVNEATTLLGQSGVGPSVLGADADAFVQTLVDGKELRPLCEIAAKGTGACLPLAQAIGRVIAGVHSLPFKDNAIVSPHTTWWASLPEKMQAMPCEQREPRMALYNCMDSWPKERGIGGQRVLGHGDFHLNNVLMLDNSSTSDGLSPDVQLSVIDLELCGPNCRAFDLAFFFSYWDSKKFGGNDTYPDLDTRTIIARSYLQAAGLDSSDAELNNFLWEIEFECIRVAWWRRVLFEKEQGRLSWQVVDVLNVMKADGVEAAKVKHDSITEGLLQYASAAAKAAN